MVAKKPRPAPAPAPAPAADPNIAIKKLQQIQDELQKVTKEANEEILEIEQNYMEKRKPVYKRRHKIIGEIPEFWRSVFLTHPSLQNLLTEEDQKIFVYLDSINVEDFADPRKGYCITFKFKANPFFKNKELIKTIKLLDEGSAKSIGTNIHWKAGNGKRPAGRADKKGSKRPLPSDSFFTWFGSADEVERDLVAEIIREEIWLNPIDHISYPDDEDDYEDDDDDDDDYDEDDDDEDGNG